MRAEPARATEAGPRSHFLAANAVPDGPKERLLRFAPRGAAIAGLAGGGLWLVTAVRARRFDPDGPGRLLYWLHDHVALPVWGHAWTAIHPYGAIWLAVSAFLLGIAIAGGLFGMAPMRVLQRRLTLRLVRRPAWRRRLVGWHRWAVGRGLRPLLFEAVLQHDRRLAMDALAEVRDGTRDAGARTAAARRLAATALAEAGLGTGTRGTTCPQAVPVLAEAAVTLAIEGAAAGEALPDEVARDLSDLADELAARVAAAVEHAAFEPAILGLPLDDFDWRRPAAEIAALLRETGAPAGPSRIAVRREVAESVNRRQALIEGLRHGLERDMAARPVRAGLPSEPATPADPAAGRLAVLAALLLADRVAVPHIGVDSVEAWDALALVAMLRRDGGFEGRSRTLHEAAGALCADAVDTDIYRLAARLAAREDPAFQVLFAEAGDILQPGDRAMLRADIEAFALAAGLDADLPAGRGGRP